MMSKNVSVLVKLFTLDGIRVASRMLGIFSFYGVVLNERVFVCVWDEGG